MSLNKNKCSVAATGPPIHEISTSTTSTTWGHWDIPGAGFRGNPRSLSCPRAEILLSLLSSSTSLSSYSSSSSSWGWWPWYPWCPCENPWSLSSSKAEKFEFDFFDILEGRTERRREGRRRDAQVTYTIRWSRIKGKHFSYLEFQCTYKQNWTVQNSY